MVSIKTQGGAAKQYDPGTSVYFVRGASDRCFQLICCHGQVILDGSALASSFGCAVLSRLLSPLSSCAGSQVGVYVLGKGIKGALLVWRHNLLRILVIPLPLPCSRRH